MQKDLIKDLCLTQGLIDIAGTGTASQSSTSKWSKENDAQRALSNNNFANFAFHTEKEKNPWWQVEFEKPVNPEYVVINNRKQEPFDEIASELSVIAYDDEDNKKILHSGTVYFGSENQGCPLIIPLKGNVSLKKLRITLLKENYLHLSNIRLLAKDGLKNIKQLTFFSNRTDGMGERLRAMLNALLLSEKIGGDFKFTWQTKNRDFHATQEKNLIFSKSFQSEHLIEGKEFTGMQLYPLQKLASFNKNQERVYDGFLVQQNKISTILPYPYIDFSRDEYKKAFNSIGFSEGMQSAKNHAESIPLTNKVAAIHIRAGDIVFGQFRWQPIFYNKIIPIFLIESTIQLLIDDGFNVIIFGQDDDFCNYLANKYKILYSKNFLRRNYNESQIALFDVVLMSRCHVVTAGSSGFATLAGWIGVAEQYDGYQYFPNLEDKLTKFSEFLESNAGLLYANEVHPFIKSFSIIQFVYRFRKSLSLSIKINCLERCVNLDEENLFYKIFLLSLYYKDNKIKEGDLYLERQLEADNLQKIEILARNIHWNGTTPLTQFINDFDIAANQGSVGAALILLLNDIYMKKNINIDFYENIVKNKENLLIAVSIIEKLKNYS